MTTELEIRVAISATPYFFRRIHFMAASLERLKPFLPEWELCVFIGADHDPVDLEQLLPWSKRYPIKWFWSDAEAYKRDSYWVNSLDTVCHPVQSRFVMFADADVIFVRPFPELFTSLESQPGIAGVIAHWPPVGDESVVSTWSTLFRGFGLGEPRWEHQHSGWGYKRVTPESRYTPAYYNFGMVLGTAEEMRIVAREMPSTLEFVNGVGESFFRYQFALTLIMYKFGIVPTALPVRYNFPNDPGFDQLYPSELNDIRILHYLRTTVVDRDRDFESIESVRRIIEHQDLTGSNRVFQDLVAELYPVVANAEGT